MSELTDEAREALGDLLAVIHGDGGHYEAEHGTVKAGADAEAAWYARAALLADYRTVLGALGLHVGYKDGRLALIPRSDSSDPNVIAAWKRLQEGEK